MITEDRIYNLIAMLLFCYKRTIQSFSFIFLQYFYNYFQLFFLLFFLYIQRVHKKKEIYGHNL